MMRDSYEEAFAAIVFKITQMIFGDNNATIGAYQRIVANALRNLDVDEVIEGLRPNE
jgi:hypothetical protein